VSLNEYLDESTMIMKQSSSNSIREWHNVDREIFERQILPLHQPAVLKNLVANWGLVKAAKSSEEDAVNYLILLDNNRPVYTIIGAPEIDGRFFYSEDLRANNFYKTEAAMTAVLEQLYALRDTPKPHSVAVQAASIRQMMPDFEVANAMPLLDETTEPTLWLGNRAVVAAHYDVHPNIACVAVGKRRFTLFPPEQIANLYIGPTLNAPGGVPISLVDLLEPDYQKFPKYAEALANSQSALLEPGDAIYIPTPWWHAVESLDNINVLVNYWWSETTNDGLSPSHSLMHSMLTIAKLEPSEREAWSHFFNYLVFQLNEDPKSHLPAELNDLVTTLTEEQRRDVYQLLKSKLS